MIHVPSVSLLGKGVRKGIMGMTVEENKALASWLFEDGF